MGRDSSNQRSPQLVDHVSESSDEEIDEDMAFNSDDERKYGALFGGGGDDDDDSSDEDSSDEESDDEDSDGIASDDGAEGGDGGQYMLDLLNNLDKKEDTSKKEKEDTRKALAHSSKMKESEFSTVVKGTELTLDQLMGGITDTKGFGDVQKTMKDMTTGIHDEDKRLSTTQTPVAKVVSDRAQRKIAYGANVQEVAQWTTVTKRNREAETLDFRPKERIRMSKDELVGKFEATTDFEKEMASALEESGAADEKQIMENEEREMFGDDDDDDLGRNKLSAEEYRKRHGELAKMRALMFYEEQKRHHINKIKSKKYRKIRKKQRIRLKESEDAEAAEGDTEYARELEEKAEMERMKERMSLKHRNTSKWAKRVLRRGANVDSDTRKALSEQVRIGDELKKKMNGHYSDSDDDDTNLLEQARAILTEVENNDEDDHKRKGLFKMDFMKKGLEAQRERARKEARELLMELEANEDMMSDDGMKGDSDDEKNYSTKKRKNVSVATSKEMEVVLPKGKLIATSLEFGNSNAVSVSGAIELDTVDIQSSCSGPTEQTSGINLSNVQDDVNEEKHTTDTRQKSPDSATGTEVARAEVVEEESNPWIRSSEEVKTEEDNDHRAKKSKKTLPSVSSQGIVNVADAVNVITGDIRETVSTNASKPSQPEDSIKSKTIASLSQEELVKKAFATISEDDVEKEFENEKETMRDRDDLLKKKKLLDDKKVSGWGSWAGEGAPAPRPLKKLPKRLQAPEKKMQKKRRKDDGKKNVIISAKRVKKNAQFQIENIPHPYSSREQYERAMAGAMGAEWNVTGAVKNMTRPEVLTRAGKIIRPISKKAKVKRAPLVKFK